MVDSLQGKMSKIPTKTADDLRYEHQNKVELLGHYGGDLTHAQSAWTSTFRDIDEAKMTRMPSLLKMLAVSGHETPFEKSSLHFLVTTEIASHIHIIKHRIGTSVNGESSRYKELKDDKFYVPTDWSKSEQTHYSIFMENALKEYHDCLARLVAQGVDRKRAKESARFYLPYGNQLTADVMFNFRSFVHFLRLRYSAHAQVEIRNIAKEMLEQVVALEGAPFEHTLRAFGLVDDSGVIIPPFK